MAAEAVLKKFQEHPDAWTRVDAILEHSKNPQTKFFGLQVCGACSASRRGAQWQGGTGADGSWGGRGEGWGKRQGLCVREAFGAVWGGLDTWGGHYRVSKLRAWQMDALLGPCLLCTQ